jgi:hypothetical protein
MHRFSAMAAFARFVLAWFVVSLGVATAAPVVQPQALQLICGAGAVKLLPQPDDGQAAATTLTLDCALCSPAVVPPPAKLGLAAAVRSAPPRAERAPEPAADQAALRPPARGPPQGQPG